MRASVDDMAAVYGMRSRSRSGSAGDRLAAKMPILRVVDNLASALRASQLRRRVLKYSLSLTALVGFTACGMFAFDTRNDGSLGERWFRSLWDAFNGVTTLGDFSNLNRNQKIYMMLCFGFVVTLGSYALTALGELLVGTDMMSLRETRRTRHMMTKMMNHVIVIGYNSLGQHVAKRLRDDGRQVVVVDRDEAKVSKASLDGFVVVNGDAGADQTLVEAGVKSAQSLIVALSQGPERVPITLMSRAMNPGVHIMALAVTNSGRDWLEHAGANEVVSSESLITEAFCRSLEAKAASPVRS